MSNRIYDRALCLDKQMVTLYGNIVVGGTGSVYRTKGLGIASVVRNSTGNYTIKLEDAYNRYMFGGWGIICPTSHSGVMAVEVFQAPANLQSTFQSAKTIIIQCYDKNGSVVDPASGCVLGFSLVCRRTTVGVE